MRVIKKSIIIKLFLVLSVPFLLFTLIYILKAMSNTEKLQVDYTISFFLIDKNSYSIYQEQIERSVGNIEYRNKIIYDFSSIMIEALQKETHKFTALDCIDLEEVNKLYEHSSSDGVTENSKKHLLSFLIDANNNPSNLDETDYNYLLNVYFYYSCVVTFNKVWYSFPQLHISKQLTLSLKKISPVFRKIHDWISPENILEPLKTNLLSSGDYNKIKDDLAREMLLDIMAFPMLGANHPLNLEIKNFQNLSRLMQLDSSYSLCVLPVP